MSGPGPDHDHLARMLSRLKLTAVRDRLDGLLDEAAHRELSLRETLTGLFPTSPCRASGRSRARTSGGP